MKRVLKMLFTCENGKTVTWNLENPNTGITYLEVSTVMDNMITDEFILYNGSRASEIKNAYIYETNTVELS